MQRSGTEARSPLTRSYEKPAFAPRGVVMNSIFTRIWHVYRIVRQAHGVHVVPIFVALLFVQLRTLIFITMALDHVFFPKLRRVRLRSPIVIVGNPRTGTTFLQRFL